MAKIGNSAVKIIDESNLPANVNDAGRLEVDVASLSIGDVTVALDAAGDSVECIQDTAAHLLATVTQASTSRSITGTVEVVQDTPADLTATVTQASAARTVSGTVEVEQDTAADLHATVQIDWANAAIPSTSVLQAMGSGYGVGDRYLQVNNAVRTDTNPAPLSNVGNGDWSPLQVNDIGALYVSLPPNASVETYDEVFTVSITTTDDTAWRTFQNKPGSEVMITSHPDNVDDFEISEDGEESAGIILKPTDHLSLPITNSNLLDYKKAAHTTTDQIIMLMVLI